MSWTGASAPAQQPPSDASGSANRVVAHEWGVWVVEDDRPTHLRELAAELPPFVYRMATAEQLPSGPELPLLRSRVPARKPVLFLYARQPTELHIRVGFHCGEPWMAYPRARRFDDSRRARPFGGSLEWDVIVAPRQAPDLRAVDPGHWWNDLRRVGGSRVVTESGEGERFLFYDGPVTFSGGFAVNRERDRWDIRPMTSETLVFRCEGSYFALDEVTPGAQTQLAKGDMSQLRARLDALLEARGLTAPEARSLLDTWRDELFRDPRPKVVYLLTREAYDAMLPLTIRPQPDELVRVGLVIDRG